MAIDVKYGRVTTELGDFGEDEPVIVFRAKDKLLPNVLAHYMQVCIMAGSPRHHLSIILDTIARVRDWQSQNPTKVPDSMGMAGQQYVHTPGVGPHNAP